MGVEILAALVVLALIDSTSFGTLLIPIWLMMAPGRLRARRILLFLGSVAGFYFALGIALTAGGMAIADEVGDVLDSGPVRVVQLIVGVVLLILGLTVEPLTKSGKEKRAAKRALRRTEKGPGRLQTWRARATAGDGRPTGLVGLALGATTIEAASMLPYLAAIGLISTSDLSLAGGIAVLAGYCLVMVAPAVFLLVARILLHERVSPLLARMDDWLSRNSRELLAWLLFLLGLFLVRSAVAVLAAP